MIEITKENFNCEETVDKYQPKQLEAGDKKLISTEGKTILYLIGAFLIFTIANTTLIYNFFRILRKL